MHELHAILDATRSSASADDAVLATVVHVTGSAYRRPGARMLIQPGGGRIGTVSGGCLEGEITRKAWWWTEEGRPVIRVYDTTSDDDAVWTFGLGCNGVVHVLLERVQTPETRALLDCLDAHRRQRRTLVVATVCDAGGSSGVSVGDRLFVNDGGIVGGSLANHLFGQHLLPLAVAIVEQGPSCWAHVDTCAVCFERIEPPPELIVVGAGDDARPLVAMALGLGWDVTVADGRPTYARADRFPGARVVVLPVERPAEGVTITSQSAVVLMTHNYVCDRTLLGPTLDAGPRYLGLLGPRARSERLFADIGRQPPPFVHAPVGLDLGADTPAGIALSILADVQAALAGRTGLPLAQRGAPIHEPVRETGLPVRPSMWMADRPAFCESTVGYGGR